MHLDQRCLPEGLTCACACACACRVPGERGALTLEFSGFSARVSRRMLNLSSTCGHRVVDGQLAGQKSVQAVRASLECPALLFFEYPLRGIAN